MGDWSTWCAVMLVALGTEACAEKPPATPPPAAHESHRPAVDASLVPEGLLGWYVARRCAVDLAPIQRAMSFRIARDRVDVLYGDGNGERLDVRLVASKQDDWNALSARYEVGKAVWMTDGFVLVEGPNVSPARAARYRDRKDLTTIYRRITFQEHEDGLTVVVAQSSATGQHSNPGRLECLLEPAPKEASRLDDAFADAIGPSACARAAACCRALRAAHGVEESDDTIEVCSGSAALTPQYCRSWQRLSVETSRTESMRCAPEGDHQRCELLDPPLRREPPTECVP